MPRSVARPVLVLAAAVSALLLGACATPTEPSNEACGGVYGGVGTRCAIDGDSTRTGNA